MARLALTITAVLILIFGTIYIGIARSQVRAIPDYTTAGNGIVELVEIPEGGTISDLGPELVERDVVKSNAAFQAAANANPKAAMVNPGVYRLQQQMQASLAVAALLDPANKVKQVQVPGGATLMDVHVVGGTTRPGIFSQISSVTCEEAASKSNGQCVTVQQLEQAAAYVDPATLGVPDWALEQVRARGNDPRRLEGLILPGDYVINPGQNAQALLAGMLQRSAGEFAETGIVDRAAAIGLTPYELVTAASLVEREAPAGEFGKVARVIVNRMAVPMRLEFDSTVNYGLDDVEVATTDEDRARETAWNTYVIDGLPQTPIASPSLEAIQAMENPEPGDWLFFVTVDDSGRTVFTNNFDDHQNAVNEALNSGILDSQR